MARPLRTAILGSCVTRDAFAAHPEALGSPAEYFARTALASAMSPVVVEGVDLSSIPSAFQRRVVGYDLDRAFLDFLERGELDLLVYDLIDERFPLLVLDGGGVVTRSGEFLRATADLAVTETVAPWTERSYALWEEAWSLLVARLRDLGLLERLVVNDVRWADVVEGGGQMPDVYPPTLTARANYFLGRMSARMRRDLAPSQLFTYDGSLLTATSEHRWGTAPFHYVPAYYRAFADRVSAWSPPARGSVPALAGGPAPGAGASAPASALPPPAEPRRGLLHRARAALAGRRDDQAHDLVISFLFPPAAETSGIVVAKRIAERGVPVDVVASEPPPGREPDDSALEAAGGLLREVRRLPSIGNELREWSVVEHFCTLGEQEITALEAGKGGYRTVYSRSMMPASHVLAALYKLAHPDVPWTAELSDPLLTDTHGERRVAPVPDTPVVRRLRSALEERDVPWPGDDQMFALVETLVWLLADTIVFTNDVQRHLMLSSIHDQRLFARAAERSVVLAHPTPAPALYERVQPRLRLERDVVNLAYFGVFFGTRSVDDLTAAITHLAPDDRAALRLSVFTDKPRRTRRRVEEAGLDDVVRVRRFVPYLEFLALTTRFDVLVLADARAVDVYGINPYLPSKLSDYLGAGTPVWALVEPSSPMSRVPGLTTTPLGDVTAAADELRRMVARARGRDGTDAGAAAAEPPRTGHVD